MKKLKAIDLFSGIGGIRLGFESEFSDLKFVYSSEIDKHAAITYEKNFGEDPLSDITKISANDIPDHDILLAGFPCQPFSHAGKKKGFNDTRGTLFFNVAEIIKIKGPQVVFLENVAGLLSNDNGNTFKRIIEILEVDLGYDVHWKKIKGTDLGEFQQRPRVYIVAFKTKTNFSFPKKTGTAKNTVREILDNKPSVNLTLPDGTWQSMINSKKRNQEKGWGFGYSLIDLDSHKTRTISARYYKDGSDALVPQKNKNPRKLSVKEVSRLQGFPKSFKFSESKIQSYKQLGNSVIVPVVGKIASKIKEALYE